MDVVVTGPEPLVAWRRRRGWSRAALAARAAVSLATVYRIESGITHPRPGVARRLAAALGTDPRLVAELAEAIPRLGGERDHLAASHDDAGGVDEPQFPAQAAAEQATHKGI
jgi:transcriptional regulator with XRE-family HTH domain